MTRKKLSVLAAPFQVDGHDIFVTSSGGIAMYPHDGADVPSLVKHADSARYRAKKTNSGFQFYEASMEHAIAEHVRAMAAAGAAHLQLVLDPITEASIETAGEALALLDAG